MNTIQTKLLCMVCCKCSRETAEASEARWQARLNEL